MLSRAAERVYWTGRYLDRAENTARIVQQYSQLLLDLPNEAGVEWAELVRIVGAAAAYRDCGWDETEASILEFLLADRSSPSSLMFALSMARENVRNTRDLLPQESWENVNELYQYALKNLKPAAAGRNRFDILSEVIGRCQQINGVLRGTMSHHTPFHFLVLGQNIERADMTSRIIDVAAAYVQHNEVLVRRYGSSLWTNVLKSVSGFQMYRQYCQPQVEGFRVIDFLINDTAFPRAVACCLEQAGASSAKLPRAEQTVAALERVASSIEGTSGKRMTATDVSRCMDELQKRLGDVHRAIVDTWFLPGDSA